ncbi:MAG: NCS2 family permease [Leptospiraceae bacterium]|nr:NCS2 family permease [Leptospiraceae bacterium]MCP5502467.1 NCS2 family permease [Leptospiraceae bacterium]
MKNFRWFVAGDIDGFFGLMVDNLIQLLVLLGLCHSVLGFPLEFLYRVVLPGIAISLIVGNFFYAYQAARLAKKENRDDVTALPYGVNTVSLFAFIFFVMLPVYIQSGDYKLAWKIGLVASFWSGCIEFFGAFVADFIRKATPRAALLSALAGIAMTFISMDFLIRTFQNPLIAFVPLGIILLQYFGKFRFPFRIPGGLVSVLVGTAIAWSTGFWQEKSFMDSKALAGSGAHLGFYFPVFSLNDFLSGLFDKNVKDYLSVIIPMGIFNVVGSLQNIESAEAAGDRFETRSSLLINGAGTLVGTLFGSPFPTTIYIGHPGWKGLGARAGYSVLNGVFMTIVCLFGLMGILQALIPIEAGMAIILWIGFIIGSQAFSASPPQHSPAIVVGLFPAFAGWAVLIIQSVFNFANGKLQGILKTEAIQKAYSIQLSDVPLNLPFLPYTLGGLLSLSQGFLLVSMIWSAICVFIIEKEFKKSFFWSLIAAALSLTGLIHSFNLSGNAILNNFSPNYIFALSYTLLAVLFLLSTLYQKKRQEV